MQMKGKVVLVLLALAILSMSVASFAAEKKAAPGVKEFIGELRGADAVGRSFWIKKSEGEEEFKFLCDKKSLWVTKKGKKSFARMSDDDFMKLYKSDKKVRVTYVEQDGDKLVKTIGPADEAK